MEFRSAVRTARKNQGFVQKEVAGQLNITRKYFSLIEQGHKVPSPQLQNKICTVLKIQVSYYVPPQRKKR